jgi:hypothetical protein
VYDVVLDVDTKDCVLSAAVVKCSFIIEFDGVSGMTFRVLMELSPQETAANNSKEYSQYEESEEYFSLKLF